MTLPYHAARGAFQKKSRIAPGLKRPCNHLKKNEEFGNHCLAVPAARILRAMRRSLTPMVEKTPRQDSVTSRLVLLGIVLIAILGLGLLPLVNQDINYVRQL